MGSTSTAAVLSCIVCADASVQHFIAAAGRDYWRCEQCGATFLDPAQRLTPDEELARYRRHQNDPADAGYRAHLARLVEPLLAKLPPGAQGLDYGCGPGPALAQMLTAAGHRVALYDAFFYPERDNLARQYDFIACSETVEHFHDPAAEFARFDGLLRPGGVLAILTAFPPAEESFADWHYRRDPTHVVFYRPETFAYLATCFGWSCEVVSPGVVLMSKI